jgi:dTDP-4-amino-4,6-dideoxygalactose transaminase
MIPLAKQHISEKAYTRVQEVLRGGWWTMGKYTEQLEQEFARYVGAKYAVAVSSCSAALMLAVVCSRMKSVCVMVPSLTFCSTVNAAILTDNKPLFCDVDRATQCIDPAEIEYWLEHRITAKVLIIVHFAGYPCDMDRIMRLVRKYKLFLIEDCAHAVETRFNGKHVGTFGKLGCYSFNPTKNLAAPEMGMVVTNNWKFAQQIRKLRLHGLSVDSYSRVNRPGQYDILRLGYKMNPTDVEAVVALDSFHHLGENAYRRFAIAVEYNKALVRMKDEGYFNGQLPLYSSERAWHLYTIQINNRDKFIREMRKRDIFCGIHYRPVHTFTYYKKMFGVNHCPNAEWIGEHTVSLPLGPGMTWETSQVIIAMTELFKTGEYLFEDSSIH